MITPPPPLQVEPRLRRLQGSLGDAGVDALIVTTLANVRYLSGFSGSAGVLAVTPDAALLTTDGRYRTQSAEQLAAAGAGEAIAIEIGGGEAQRNAVRGLVGSAGRVGLEADNVTWSATPARCPATKPASSPTASRARVASR